MIQRYGVALHSYVLINRFHLILEGDRGDKREKMGTLPRSARRWGRDVALSLGRMRCRMRELTEAAGVSHDGSVATALRYLEQRRSRDLKLSRLMVTAEKRLMNKQM